MFEFQAKVSVFEQSLLSTLQRAVTCPPSADFGVQLQRVRFVAAKLRHNQEYDFTVSYRQLLPDNDPPKAHGFQTQLAVTARLEVARTQTIEANPNQLVAPEAVLQLTVVIDLQGVPAANGCLAVARFFHHVEFDQFVVGGAAVPGWLLSAAQQWVNSDQASYKGPFADDVEKARVWARDKITRALPKQSLVFDLSFLLPKGKDFANAGVSVDTTGQCLSIRADQLTDNDWAAAQWQPYYAGNFSSRLNGNAWALFLRAEDLKLTLQTRVWDAVRDALGDDSWRLVTVAVDYAVSGATPVFTVTLVINLPVLPVQSIPVAIAISLDQPSGRLVVDINAYGLRDSISSIERFLDTVFLIVMPVVGIIPVMALHDSLGDFEAGLSSSFAQEGAEKLGDDGEFTEVPGLPFHYRLELPLATPSFVNGRIDELHAFPDGIAVCGSWGLLHWQESEVSIDVSQFSWNAPKVSCNTADHAADQMRRSPKDVAILYARIALSASGSMPIGFCGVDVIDDGGAPGGIRITTTSDAVPLLVEIESSPAYADLAAPRPVKLRVRTSAGMFLVVLDVPAPLTPANVKSMADALEIQRMACEVVLPEWFRKHGRFKLDWIVDPLPDPAFERISPELVRIEFAGMPGRAEIALFDERQAVARMTVARSGSARLTAFVRRGGPAPEIEIRPLDAKSQPARGQSAARVELTRHALVPAGQLFLAERTQTIHGLPFNFGPARFAVVCEDACMILDASRRGRPSIERKWRIPGVRGIAATRTGIWAWGDSGIVVLEDSGRVRTLAGYANKAVLAGASSRRWLAFAFPERIELFNSFGGVHAQLAVEAATALCFVDSGLVVGTRSEISVLAPGETQPRTGRVRLAAMNVRQLRFAPLTGALFAQRAEGPWSEIRPDGEIGATYAAVPWEARTASTGRTLAHLGSGGRIEMYRRMGGPQPATPRIAAPRARARA